MEQSNKMFDFSELLLFLIKKWKLICGSVFVVGILAFLYVLYVVECQFASSVTFLPPFSQRSIIPSFISSDFFGGFSSTSEIQPEQIKILFGSQALKRKVIDKFNYIEKFKLQEDKNPYVNAIKQLDNDLVLGVGEQGSFGVSKPISFTITSYHTSPDTCHAIANYTFTLLDSMIREVSREKGRRDKLFLEEQIALNQTKLDSLQAQYEKFQIENKVYEISEQMKMTLQSYGQLKAKLISNQLRIKTLLMNHGQSYPEVVALKNENRVIQAKLKQMEQDGSSDVVVGLERSANLIPKQVDYERRITIQNKLLVLLSQQLQEAKIQEARDISTLKVVDPAIVPLYKARPKRLQILVGGVGVYTIFLFMALYFQFLYKTHLKDTYLVNELRKMFKRR
ncbi:MAG: hypothetical protein GF344_09380 [Chitinivibrionales bacterium]|nr:hypothetical protein [Chitinivibrionales bacterium]MBD3357062.1 hypothetical protein [Chitinivibrionales bacterium]